MRKRTAVLGAVCVIIITFYVLGLDQYFTLNAIKNKYFLLKEYQQLHPVLSGLLYCLAYTALIAVSLPVATVLSLLAGALFGLFWGTVVVSFASSIGASLSFLLARYVLREAVNTKFLKAFKIINQGLKKDGVAYLFTLRLAPVFPFFIINLLMGLTTISLKTFYWVSQIGMLPATLVYVNAGEQLSLLTDLSGILSPIIILSLCVIAFFPWLMKFIVKKLGNHLLS